jgi:pimeloyl-ACP methyl ester carboxylesterase
LLSRTLANHDEDNMNRMLILLMAGVVLLYLLYAGYFYLNQRSILFPRHLITVPVTVPSLPGLEEMWLDTSQGRVEAWYLPPLGEAQTAPAPLCILAHGNGDLIDRWLSSVTALREMGVGVLLVEYPGYGRSEGNPSYAAIHETFLLAYDTIIRHPQVDPQRILLFGHSLGGGAVSALAAERPSSGMILFSTFTSVPALAAEQWLPGFAVQDVFNTLEVVQTYPHPILVIHGKYDRTIPYHHGVALHAAAQQGELISLDCGHNGCIDDWDKFWHDLRPFFVRAGIVS